MSRYDDIIKLNRPKSRYKSMSLMDRAAQFAPFAALTTHGESVIEVDRITDKRIELSEEEIKDIDTKLKFINANINNKIKVSITYFIPDNKKSGGKYEIVSNNVRKIDLVNKYIIFIDNTKINLNDIVNIAI